MNVDSRTRNRNRMWLIAIFAMFFGSMLVAGLLRFSGWRPEGMKNHGELLQPPGDLRQVVPTLAGGGAYHWDQRARIWRIALAPPASCTTECEKLARDLDKVWRLFGKDADRVHVLWVGTPPAQVLHPDALRQLQPDPAIRAALPRVDGAPDEPREGVPVYVIDPNGFVIMRYPAGFDPAGLRTDLSRLLKLR
ncbi:SCO family protein [Lysobacter sp. D1-1-M9]|uniref:SCO family protein n=1 Tax=Novilysobacter longmucuonensis TaxID=3098603 RepID=UPI002FCB790D